MGLIYTEIGVTNADDIALAKRGYIQENEIRHQEIEVLVDSGAYMLTLNRKLADQLGLDKVSEQEAELAGGSIKLLDVVGPVKVTFENRISITSAMVVPKGEPLLGAIPMEDLDVVIHPLEQRLVVNPKNPYIAKKSLK